MDQKNDTVFVASVKDTCDLIQISGQTNKVIGRALPPASYNVAVDAQAKTVYVDGFSRNPMISVFSF